MMQMDLSGTNYVEVIRFCELDHRVFKLHYVFMDGDIKNQINLSRDLWTGNINVSLWKFRGRGTIESYYQRDYPTGESPKKYKYIVEKLRGASMDLNNLEKF